MMSRQLGIAIGAWYVVAPFVWGYVAPFNWWHSVVLGAAVLALAGAQMISRSRIAAWLLAGVGVYSMVSPFVHDYLTHSRPFFNDLFFGVVLVGVAVAHGAHAVELRARPRADADA